MPGVLNTGTWSQVTTQLTQPERCNLDVFDIHDITVAFGVRLSMAYDLTRGPGLPAPFVVGPRTYRWPANPVLAFRESLRGTVGPLGDPSRGEGCPADGQGPGRCLCAAEVFSVHEVARVFRLQRTAVYGLTRREGFPAPMVLSSRCYRWPAAEVVAFRDCLRRASEVSV
jgi:predicted DNA-binding transcriptional regulator AlpA